MASTNHERLRGLASNLWWSWEPDVVEIFHEIDAELWRKTDHNPIVFLQEMSPEQLDARAAPAVLAPRIDSALARLHGYLSAERTWAAPHAGPLHVRPVCYFSAEFGVHESLPLYSGGLGLLAGDHLKSASDLGVPLVGIGLYYAQGYFRQVLDSDGNQIEEHPRNPAERLPFHRAFDRDGKPVIVKVETPEGDILAAVWRVYVGRVTLLLLDTDVDGNSPADRGLSARLYEGDRRVRIRQEMLLGIGGMRALEALAVLPGVIHLNEGHCAFAPLELIRRFMHENGMNFDSAWREIRRMTVFTTHTPVEAGHDRFSSEMIEEHLGTLRKQLLLDEWSLLAMGRVEPNDEHETFCMTVLAMKCASRVNGVSALHGHVSRRMWQCMYPGRVEGDVPIGHVTNGVHMHSYCSPRMARLFAELMGEDWSGRLTDPKMWEVVDEIDDGRLWAVRNEQRAGLVEFVRRRLIAQAKRRGESADAVAEAARALHPAALTIGFARRFATYKRAPLIFREPDRLAGLLSDPQRPMQLVFAGKAHPADDPGKSFIRRIFEFSRDPRFRGKVVFIENYDINVSRHMVQGVDVWLNNPLRPLEACGTSGQKVILNGGLNLSVLDGWWAEAYDGKNGFAIGDVRVHVDPEVQMRRDAASLIEQLENLVVPLFYERDGRATPHSWLRRVKQSMRSLAWRFNADRMLMDYMLRLYLPAATALSSG